MKLKASVLKQPATKKDIQLVRQDTNNLRVTVKEEFKNAEMQTNLKLAALDKGMDENARSYRDQMLAVLNNLIKKFDTLQKELLLERDKQNIRITRLEKITKLKKSPITN